MFDFLLAKWILGRLTEAKIDLAVRVRYITFDEGETIKATPITGGA